MESDSRWFLESSHLSVDGDVDIDIDIDIER